MQKQPFYTALYRWYEQNSRPLPWRETDDPYAVWISEIILQQTRVAQGTGYYLRFLDRFPDVRTLAAADESEVLRLWQGLGYYSRARNLHRAARTVVEQGMLPFPATFDSIRSLPGIGDYTAGAIASFAYNLPYPAMDGNVCRVVARLADCDIPFDTAAGKKHFRNLVLDLLDRDNPRLFNSAIMEFGALCCTPSLSRAGSAEPVCTDCPLRAYCAACEHHTAPLLPVRKARPVLRDRYFNYYIYLDPAGSTLIRQRTGRDIWQHLYEFPLREEDRLLPPAQGQRSRDFTHVLSHQRLHVRFFLVPSDPLPAIPGTLAVPLAALDAYPFSRLTLNAIDAFFA